MATHGLFEKAILDKKDVSISVREIFDPNASTGSIDDADRALEAMGYKPVSFRDLMCDAPFSSRCHPNKRPPGL